MEDIKNRIRNEIDKYENTIGIYADDLKGNKIEINVNKTFETASCIKLFILIDLYKQIFEGKKNENDILKYDEVKHTGGSGVIKDLELGLEMTAKNTAIMMIVISDNIATNMLIDYLGIESINKTICDLGCTHTKLLNKVDWKNYSQMGITTPKEYAMAFKKILNNEICTPKICEEILEILKKQHYNDMLTKYLPQYDIDKVGEKDSLIKYIASKDGAIDGQYLTPKVNNVRNDGGIIGTKYGEYIITIFIEKFKDRYFYYNNPTIDCGAKISELIFNTYIDLKGTFKYNEDKKR